MHIGIHISKGPGGVDRSIDTMCSRFGFNACQIFTIVPQQVKLIEYDPALVAAVVKRHRLHVWIHSSYLVSPWGDKPYNMGLSIKQLKQQVEIGARGVIFHIPKAPPEKIVARYKALLDRKPAGSQVVLENKAVRPEPENAVYAVPENINRLVDVFLKHGVKLRDIAFCFDTAHLYCSGVSLRSYEDARLWLSKIKYPTVIKAFHLNGNSSSGYADKHVIAFDKKDKIWGGIEYRSSGVRAIAEFCRKRKVDILLECDFANEQKQALELIKLLRGFS